jgi:hypothetical protein
VVSFEKDLKSMKKLLFLVIVLTVFGVAQVMAAVSVKPHHKENGLSCKDCHTTAPKEAVPTAQCLTCHDLPEAMEVYKGAPVAHDSPHYGPGIDCALCHQEHGQSENYCNNCHDFDFQVP